MRQNRLFAVVLWISLVTVMGCEESTTDNQFCVANETQSCVCLEDGEVVDGVQTCNDDGGAFSDCQCSGNSDGTSSVAEDGSETDSGEGNEEEGSSNSEFGESEDMGGEIPVRSKFR